MELHQYILQEIAGPITNPPIGEEFFDSSRVRTRIARKHRHSATPDIFLREWRDYRNQLRELGKCRIVCKTWNIFFTDLFYKIVWCRHPRHVYAFLNMFGDKPYILERVHYLRIDWAIPPGPRYTKHLEEPHFGGWPIHSPPFMDETVPYRIHDSGHPSWEVRQKWFRALCGLFPNVTELDTGFTGTGQPLTCLPIDGFLDMFLEKRPKNLPLRTYRGVWYPSDLNVAHVLPKFKHLVELSLDIVCRPSNAPRGVSIRVSLPTLQFLTVAAHYPSCALSWIWEWSLPSLEYLAVRSEDFEEGELYSALNNFGYKLKHLYLRGIFEYRSLSNLNKQCPNLVHLEIDWSESFLVFPPCSKIEAIVFHNTAWMFHALKPSFIGQLQHIASAKDNWPVLSTVQDMSVSCTTFRGRKVRWWSKEVLQAMIHTGISVIDREGRQLREQDIVSEGGSDFPASVN